MINNIPIKDYINIRLYNVLFDYVSILETVPQNHLTDRHKRKLNKIMEKSSLLAEELYNLTSE